MRYEDAIKQMPEYRGGLLEEPFLPVPRAALGLGLTPIAVLAYGLLLNRAALSAKSGWLDEEGLPYVTYAVPRMSKDLGVSVNTARRALRELVDLGLVSRRDVPGRPSRLALRLVHKEERKSVENSGPAFGRATPPRRNWRGWYSSNREGPPTESGAD